MVDTAGKPRVSIVTVTWNAATVIERTLESVLAQSYPNIEYLIIDGGSTDGTLAIVDRYRDRIATVVSEPDDGIFDAMNKSLAHVTGDWVNFMNAGDSFADPDVVAQVVAQGGDADLVCGDSYLVYPDSDRKVFEKARGLDKLWRDFIPCVHQATFVRADWLRACGFDTGYRYAADYDFFLRSHVAGKRIRFLDRVLCHFLVGGASQQHDMQLYVESLASALRHGPADQVLRHDNVFLQGLVRGYRELPGADGDTLGLDFNRYFQVFHDRVTALAARYPRMLLYGAGTVGQAILKLIPQAVVQVVDRAPVAGLSVPVTTPDALPPADSYDAVLISVLGREDGIIEDLVTRGVARERLHTLARDLP